MKQPFLAIDYGKKRIGLAFGDELGIAIPVPAATENSENERIAHIENEIHKRKIATIILGLPINMDGSEGAKTKEVRQFAEILKAKFKLPVIFVDETLSSYEAESKISAKKKGGNDAKARQKHRKTGEIDSKAAAVILQDFFNSNKIGVPELENFDFRGNDEFRGNDARGNDKI